MTGKILVLGCGSIGRRHAENLKRLGHAVVAYDPIPERRRWFETHLRCATVRTLEEGFDAPLTAAWVCTPPHKHAEMARRAVSQGIPCFIEKPLAHSAREAREIVELSRKHRVPVSVGYQLRFHPAFQWLKSRMEKNLWGRLLFVRAEAGQYLPDWRPWQDYRKSYTANRKMGGGILLDASHEIDLLRWLAGDVESVFCSASRLSRLLMDVEDTAALVLHFKSKSLGEVHLDMVQRAYQRNLELAFEEGTVLWDLPSATLRIYSAASKKWASRKFSLDFNELYVREARAFLSMTPSPFRERVGVRVKNGNFPSPLILSPKGRGNSWGGSVPAREGLRTLAVVAAAQRSARSGRVENVS